jgi:hypothetical protein
LSAIGEEDLGMRIWEKDPRGTKRGLSGATVKGRDERSGNRVFVALP